MISPSPVATGQESQGEVEAPVEAAEGSSLAPEELRQSPALNDLQGSLTLLLPLES